MTTNLIFSLNPYYSSMVHNYSCNYNMIYKLINFIKLEYIFIITLEAALKNWLQCKFLCRIFLLFVYKFILIFEGKKKRRRKHCPSSKYIRGPNISRMSRNLSFRNHEQFHVQIWFLAILEKLREKETESGRKAWSGREKKAPRGTLRR